MRVWMDAWMATWMDVCVDRCMDGQIVGWTMGASGERRAVEDAPISCPGPHLPAEVHLVQQLNPQQDADLVELLGHIEVLLQVPLHQGVQHSPVDQVVLEGLRVLGQPDVIQPGLGHPVMVQVSGFGQAGEDRHGQRDGWVGTGGRNRETGRNGAEMGRDEDRGKRTGQSRVGDQDITETDRKRDAVERPRGRERQSRDGERGGCREWKEKDRDRQRNRASPKEQKRDQ